MKSTKLFLVAVVISALGASSAMARPSDGRTNSKGRSFNNSAVRTSANHRAHNNKNWRHRHYRHHRHHRHNSRVYLSFGYGYPYYSSYPYGYGYYARPSGVVYANTDGAIVAAVQRRLARAGYYRGMIDGVIGHGTRSAIRLYERAHGLRIDGRIDRRLLATMGLA